MDYGQAWATIDGESVVTIVVFGQDEAPPLLVAYTLEGLALTVDPEAQRLVPTHMMATPWSAPSTSNPPPMRYTPNSIG